MNKRKQQIESAIARSPYTKTKIAGILLFAILMAVLFSNQPYDQFHGWWIFGYTQHVVPHAYLIASAWLIALTYLGFLTHWYLVYHPDQVKSYAGQLDLYSRTIEAATGKSVIETLIHLPLQGSLVRVNANA